jgi:hypothetical protein
VFVHEFDGSNVPSTEYAKWSAIVDGMLQQEGVDRAAIPYVKFSLVDVFNRPDGLSDHSKYLMCVFRNLGILLAREKGVLRKSLDVQAMYYSDNPGLGFAVSDREQNRGWGWYHIHGMLGGQYQFTLGWPWSHRPGGYSQTPAMAMAERDRILAALNER